MEFQTSSSRRQFLSTIAITAGAAILPRPRLGFAADIADRERAMIENALREASGRVAGPKGAAAVLGIPRQTLESKMKKLGIARPS